MAPGASPPNYSDAILDIPEAATDQQIRDAYKRAALRTHPDRVAADSPERPARTRQFQLVNDAYYTLSDAARRRDYDAQRSLFAAAAADDDRPDAPPRPSWAWGFFPAAGDCQQTQNAQFSDVFEEMMREQGMAEPGTNRPTSRFWGLLGGLSGAALGFIVANVPGMLAGALAGNRLGAVRDARGKSVYAVFQLPQDDRARLLGQLAARVFSYAVGV